MARVTDSIAATVTVNGGPAIRELAGLSTAATKTGVAFDAAGKKVAASGKTVEDRLAANSKRINEIHSKGALAQGKMYDSSVRGARGLDEVTKSATRGKAATSSLRGELSRFNSNIGVFSAVGAAVGTVTGGLHSAIQAQSALNTATKSAGATFKDSVGYVERFATSAVSIGLSKRAALQAATGFGTLFRGLQFTTEAAASFSISLTKLSSDLASKVGGSAEDAALALRAMFRGEFDPIEKYGVKVSEAAVANRALQMGLAGTKSELSEQDKTLARLTLAYTQTNDAQGDFARNSGDLANQQRILSARFENLRAKGGNIFTKAWTEQVGGYSAALEALNRTGAKFNLGDKLKSLSVAELTKSILGIKSSKDALALVLNEKLFKGPSDALEVFNRELNAGRTTSREYTGAVAYLKKANEDAERSEATLGEAIGTVTQKRTMAIQAAQASIGAIQSLMNAQRAEQDAATRVVDSRNALADAERSVAEIRKEGKVDAEQVVDAEQRVADAAQGTIDARQRQTDAERRLADLRARGAVDAERVADSERSVADATRGVVSARKALAEAEKEVARLRAGPTADEAGDAARAILRAQLDLERAQQQQVEVQQALNDSRGAETLGASLSVREAELALAEATEALSDAQQAQIDLQNRGKDGSAALTEAEDQLSEARHRAEEAVRRQTEAEATLREAQFGDPEFAANLAAAEREVDAARRGVEAAVRAEDKASADLRKARAGDPEFERNLARAVGDATRARRDLERAEQDLPVATIVARNAQDEFNAKVSEGTAAADQLRQQADRLGIAYNRLASEARGAASAVGTFTNNGSGPPGIFGGHIGSAAGLIGRRTATTPAFTSAPRASASTSTIVVPVVLDGREVARVVTRHQNDMALRG